MYEVLSGAFSTPRNRTVNLVFRADTNDADMLRSCMTEDEYGLRDLDLSGVAVDVGAHIGGVAVALLEDNPNLSVIAIEPVAENAELLRRNLERYGSRAIVRQNGAGNDASIGFSVLFRGNESAARHTFVANQTMHPDTLSERREAPGLSLAALIQEFGPLACVVIDCEGCEYDFLDSDALDKVAVIHGEYHRGRESLRALLESTHTVTFSGDEGVGLFRAIQQEVLLP